MKFGAFLIIAGYLLLIAMFGWAGLVGAVLHIGSLMLFSRWK